MSSFSLRPSAGRAAVFNSRAFRGSTTAIPPPISPPPPPTTTSSTTSTPLSSPDLPYSSPIGTTYSRSPESWLNLSSSSAVGGGQYRLPTGHTAANAQNESNMHEERDTGDGYGDGEEDDSKGLITAAGSSRKEYTSGKSKARRPRHYLLILISIIALVGWVMILLDRFVWRSDVTQLSTSELLTSSSSSPSPAAATSIIASPHLASPSTSPNLIPSPTPSSHPHLSTRDHSDLIRLRAAEVGLQAELLLGMPLINGVRMSNIFSDNMVLHMTDAVVWGWLERPEMSLTLTVRRESGDAGGGVGGGGGGETQSLVSGDNGFWSAVLKPYPASVGWSLSIGVASSQPRVFRHVAFGRVIWCMGDGDVARHLSRSTGLIDSPMAVLSQPNLRFFLHEPRTSHVPTDMIHVRSKPGWRLGSSQFSNDIDSRLHLHELSASCWRMLEDSKLHASLVTPTLTTGLVISVVSGPPSITSWSSPDGLEKCSQLPPPKVSSPEASKKFPPTSLWNGVLHPLLRFVFTSISWFLDYETTQLLTSGNQPFQICFKHMIQTWRYHTGVPFVIQLAFNRPAGGGLEGTVRASGLTGVEVWPNMELQTKLRLKEEKMKQEEKKKRQKEKGKGKGNEKEKEKETGKEKEKGKEKESEKQKENPKEYQQSQKENQQRQGKSDGNGKSQSKSTSGEASPSSLPPSKSSSSTSSVTSPASHVSISPTSCGSSGVPCFYSFPRPSSSERSTPTNVYVTSHSNRGAGFLHQFGEWIHGVYLSTTLGLHYIHSLTSTMITTKTKPTKRLQPRVERWNTFFGFELGEDTLEQFHANIHEPMIVTYNTTHLDSSTIHLQQWMNQTINDMGRQVSIGSSSSSTSSPTRPLLFVVDEVYLPHWSLVCHPSIHAALRRKYCLARVRRSMTLAATPAPASSTSSSTIDLYEKDRPNNNNNNKQDSSKIVISFNLRCGKVCFTPDATPFESIIQTSERLRTILKELQPKRQLSLHLFTESPSSSSPPSSSNTTGATHFASLLTSLTKLKFLDVTIHSDLDDETLFEHLVRADIMIGEPSMKSVVPMLLLLRHRRISLVETIDTSCFQNVKWNSKMGSFDEDRFKMEYRNFIQQQDDDEQQEPSSIHECESMKEESSPYYRGLPMKRPPKLVGEKQIPPPTIPNTTNNKP